MLPVCSATPSHYPYSLIPSHVGLRSFSSSRRITEDRRISVDGVHTREVSFMTQVITCLQSLVVERIEQGGALDSCVISSYQNEFDNIMQGSTRYKDYGSRYSEGSSLYESPPPLRGDELLNLHNKFRDTSFLKSESASTGFLSVSNSPTDIISDNTMSVSGTFEPTVEGFSKLQEKIDSYLSGISKSLDSSIGKLGNAVTETYNDAITSVTASFNDATSRLFLSSDSAKQQASTGLTGFSVKFSDSLYSASTGSIDILRQAIISLENSLTSATAFVVYSYESAKLLLPPEVKNVLDISEGKAVEILRPFGTGFQKVYFVIEQFERSLGLDPSDPVVPFCFLVGSSATLGVSYWVLTYGGYSGDLSPQLTLELLKSEENAILVDVRPEDQREKNGVPDLRRGPRYKYASVTIPQIDSSTRKLLKSGGDIEDALLAVVIRNLKIVQDGSKVIIMDAVGDRSKGIARALRKLGVKRAYLVQGGFRSWVQDGLRIKELKPETTLTVLNEETEAILEDIKPTLELVIGYGLGISTAIYALLEWEKTLQLIGIVGLGQTLYQRVASYQNSEDLKKDVRLLLVPVRLGAQAFSWAAGKLEPTKIGLPTSPSSTAVQDRVLQAAAKHGSQPSDTEDLQNSSRESTAQPNDNLDLSEA